MTANKQMHFRAVRMLALTTIFWSLSFPLVKALGLMQEELLPGRNSWFHAGLTGFVRFAVAGIVVLLFAIRTVGKLRALELYQGVGLGFFAGGGILLQMDGLNHTSASTSAFLTQAFCIVVPIIVAVRDRWWPGARVVGAIGLVVAGVSLLANLNPADFQLGRGEAETLLSAIFFGAHIVWLERPLFAENNVNHFSFVMFLVMALMSLPILVAAWRSPRDVVICYSDPGVILVSGAIILFCTVAAFVAMNRWQPFVPATEAAIIYSAEPLFATILALFLPAWLSRWRGIVYPNEELTVRLILGGGLILAANLLLQWKWRKIT